MSDVCQWHDAVPPESRRGLAQCLFEMGLPEEGVDTMIRRNPARLLGILSGSYCLEGHSKRDG
jgi:hypothetical protein